MVKTPMVHEDHPELFHYTTTEGLKGILQSQTLWATHIDCLNDVSELTMMEPMLRDRLYKSILRIAKGQDTQQVKSQIEKIGGPKLLAKQESRVLARVFFRTAFETTVGGPALAVPFITSFCSHVKDKPYVKENGLLSQWRAYGRGGYALVFDTKQLWELCKLENSTNSYSAISFGDVVYDDDTEKFNNEFDSVVTEIGNCFMKFLETHEWSVDEIYGDVVSAFARLKHRAFDEEREVRIIAFPLTEKLLGFYRDQSPDFVSPDGPLKQIAISEDTGKRHIELFESLGAHLPISRIIVGPHEDQENLTREVETLISGTAIDIHRSETPLAQLRSCARAV